MVLKLQGTDGMGNMLNGILDRMGKVIHRVNAPCIAGVVVCHTGYTVDDRVSHVDIRRSHINLGTKHLLTILILALFHFLKKL